jgi:DNA polymerase-3 subunit alpha
MALADFVHLRVHTAYSLSEGAVRIKDLSELCCSNLMPAVAITDTSNLFGGMEFSTTLAKAGVQPIIGCQLRLSRETEAGPFVHGRSTARPTADPIVVLAQTEGGYLNLLELLAMAHVHTQDLDEPQVSLHALREHAEGLILLTGGAHGPLGRLVHEGRDGDAESLLGALIEAFPGRLYVELMRHGLDVEAMTEPGMIRLAETFELPLVATNEVFFLTPDMDEAHDSLICIAESAHVSDTERRRLTSEHYFKTGAEMRALFSDLPDAVDNTILIARRCAFMIEAIDPILPAYGEGTGASEEDLLRADARRGLERRLETQVFRADHSEDERRQAAQPYLERLEYELEVICDMGFPGYFLIVAEFIQWAKDRSIPVGPGRGSGAGSVVAWALTITDLDPLRFGLLFERFLNPERVSMPDFDIDFCQDRRDEVIRHVQEKYGRDRVAQIITFGKLQARAVLRDVGRVQGMPYGHVDKICKLIPNNPAQPVTLKQAVKGEPQLQAMIESDETVARLVGIAEKLEGLYRHASTHAAGVVIGDRPLERLIPLYRDPRSDIPVTGFNMKWVEAAGLVKFDFLGLKTLTVLARALDLIKDGRRETLDLSNLSLSDSKTFKMLSRGDTVGVFQLESSGMRDVLRNLKPDTFEDIIAVVALYRPGPMDNIPSYIRRKHGEEEPDYLYPTLEGILRETHGIIIYQEQVMQIAQELSGYSLGAADLLRRAMGKKIKEEMDKQRHIFVDGATARGVPKARASHIFDLVNKFAGYGFNKSHAAAYALIAYQTAYLKANYPVEFLAASMTLDIQNTDKLNTFHQELDRLGIRLLGPDINASHAAFSVETCAEDGKETRCIRYALAATKNVGESAMNSLVSERERNGPFESVMDLTRRIDGSNLNKRQLENLVRAGAFDCLNPNRRQLFEGVETILRHASAAAEERSSEQMGLFGGQADGMRRPLTMPETPDWPPMERLKAEFEAIGFYLSAHPLDAYGKPLTRLKVTRVADLLARGQSGPVSLAGTVISKKERTSSKGSRYAFVQLSDPSGLFEVTVFSDVLATSRDLLEPGSSLFLKVGAQFEGESVRFTLQSVEALDRVAERVGLTLQVFVETPAAVSAVGEALTNGGSGRGRISVVSCLEDDTEVEFSVPGRYAVNPAMVFYLESVSGVRDVREV